MELLQLSRRQAHYSSSPHDDHLFHHVEDRLLTQGLHHLVTGCPVALPFCRL